MQRKDAKMELALALKRLIRCHPLDKITVTMLATEAAKKVARAIVVESDGAEKRIPLTENDQVYITDGGCVENATWGSQNTVAKVEAAGTCGVGLPRRRLTVRLAIPMCSAVTPSSPTG